MGEMTDGPIGKGLPKDTPKNTPEKSRLESKEQSLHGFMAELDALKSTVGKEKSATKDDRRLDEKKREERNIQQETKDQLASFAHEIKEKIIHKENLETHKEIKEPGANHEYRGKILQEAAMPEYYTLSQARPDKVKSNILAANQTVEDDIVNMVGPKLGKWIIS